ncbi:MAG: OmpA family protein [Roseovarius sp.]|nr:OmpA family protein [Roseovarius sp.]
MLGLGAVAVGAVLRNGDRVVSNTGDRVVVEGTQGFTVYKDDDALLRQPGATLRTETFSDGSSRTTLDRADGSQVETIRDARGRVLRRAAIYPDGTEYELFDDLEPVPAVDMRQFQDTRPDPRSLSVSQSDLSGLRAALREGLAYDPDRTFSLRQIREIEQVRSLVPAIDLDTVTFASGSAAIPAAQARSLVQLGILIEELLFENPREMFLIEGHTDATGSESQNLALSDRRAESVALALTESFRIPPENLIVQGYGKSFLKVPTQSAEERNRRATVRRIAPLLRQLAANWNAPSSIGWGGLADGRSACPSTTRREAHLSGRRGSEKALGASPSGQRRAVSYLCAFASPPDVVHRPHRVVRVDCQGPVSSRRQSAVRNVANGAIRAQPTVAPIDGLHVSCENRQVAAAPPRPDLNVPAGSRQRRKNMVGELDGSASHSTGFRARPLRGKAGAEVWRDGSPEDQWQPAVFAEVIIAISAFQQTEDRKQCRTSRPSWQPPQFWRRQRSHRHLRKRACYRHRRPIRASWAGCRAFRHPKTRSSRSQTRSISAFPGCAGRSAIFGSFCRQSRSAAASAVPVVLDDPPAGRSARRRSTPTSTPDQPSRAMTWRVASWPAYDDADPAPGARRL